MANHSFLLEGEGSGPQGAEQAAAQLVCVSALTIPNPFLAGHLQRPDNLWMAQRLCCLNCFSCR